MVDLSASWRVVTSGKCSEGPGFDRLYLESPCNPAIKDHTETLDKDYKGNVSSFHYKIIRQSMSTWEIHGLRLFFIDFDVPGHTPRFHWRETALQLSENLSLPVIAGIQVSEERATYVQYLTFGMGHHLYTGCTVCEWHRTEPYGTPAGSTLGGKSRLQSRLGVLFERKEFVSLVIRRLNFNFCKLRKPGRHVRFQYPKIWHP